jgi:hypothetical protein
MASSPLSREKFRKPELFLSDLLKKGAQGQFYERDENVPFLYRAAVLAIDVIGGKLENPDGAGVVTHNVNGQNIDVPANIGPKNPKNSIKARIVSDGFDQFTGDDELRVFWPFFPEHMSVPVKIGEHVYVIFEDEHHEHGLWISKVPGHEGLNLYKGKDSYGKDKEDSLANKFDDSKDVGGGDEDTPDSDDGAGDRLVNDGRLAKLY